MRWRKFGKCGSVKYRITYIPAIQTLPKDKQLCFFFFIAIYGNKISPPSLSSSTFGSDFLCNFVSYFFHLKFYHENFLECFGIYLATIYQVLTVCQVFLALLDFVVKWEDR